MKIPLSWLREYADLPADTESVAERLAMLGFPVADVTHRPRVSKVLAGRIVTIERHPNAERLFVCTVDVGDRKPLSIVTAATNVAENQRVPVATVGARLPHLTIALRTMRGLPSEGMLCSPDELALPAEWFEGEGIMQLDAGAPLGADVVTLLGLDGDVLDVEITSNRADAMCAIGLARELAASYGAPLRLPPFQNPGEGESSPQPRLDIQTPDCRRFVLQRFDRVRVGTAPAWMRVRLAMCGVRPINNFVDISNYVMLETGQPLHFYDASRVAEQHLYVRDAKPKERLTTLDGVERTLAPGAMVIADARGVLGLAGVMGGVSSEIASATSEILLEAATFVGSRVRRTASLFGLRTEASSRHEKTLAPALAELGAARAAQLVIEAGARAYAPIAAGEEPGAQGSIALPEREVFRILGIDIPKASIARHLSELGCSVDVRDDTLAVTTPLWRTDLENAADLIEEVARMEGYDAIEAAVPAVASHAISSAEYERERYAARTMRELRYHETISLSLRARAGERAVALRNPLSEEQRVLRTDLATGLLEQLVRIGKPYRIFEIGHVFSKDEMGIEEVPLLTFAFSAEGEREPEWRDMGFLRMHGDCATFLRTLAGRDGRIAPGERDKLHPGKCGVIYLDGIGVAALGRVDPRLERSLESPFALYLCTVRLDRLPEKPIPKYKAPSRFPSTYRDLALSVDTNVAAESVEQVTMQAIGDVCTGVRVFDEYRGPQVGPDRKSLAIRATMQRFDGTMSDEEADAAIARAIEALRSQLSAEVRQ
jgi:phenylalanyl-tRNA synthetase beta chain